ncbi:ABC transporter ATP-binding protein [Pseudomonas azerbaijanoccidens]|uniref:ABC transporter ATP-binding protein n=1 Tax=Pseudomonas azerbaijanoccidentalis TaxID=2842347 RepID=UPI00200A03B3|nr:ABC transporter ATP-binding protein [Pseudomonas azerbaijanoccidentalis]MCK8664760.1 ABC transporter ATP-binding protein [Pseudomonas azerbaijanoccidentalis]
MGTINVTGLGKAYKQYPSRVSRLAEWLIPFSKPRHKQKWVLEGLTFLVRPGEAVGIIGVNGAGKSTLLKMITGTTQPTVGSVQLSGRVAALLELGMGFHPDFTGRQNAIMAGQLLGLSVSEVNELMPEIEAFAEIGDYIDQPVRLYSSGMQMRLAFSVATARRPDVLIVDEALSVGDAYFQHKSFERIREFRKGGTTLLIVSHDKAAIQSVCDRAILLKGGRLAMEGKPEEVMDYYNAILAERENQTVSQSVAEDGRVQTVSGSGEASIVDVSILNAREEALKVVEVGAPVTLRVRARINSPIKRLVLGFMIKDRLGQPVFGTNTHHMQQALTDLRAGECVDFKFAFNANLGPGSYSVAVALTGSENHLSENYEWRDLALVFEMLNVSCDVFTGSVWLNPVVTIGKEAE